MPAPLKRRWKRERKARKPDPYRPPPLGYGGAPRSGAWKEQRPESEAMRQGEFQSPWTGQVYDRWAPIGLKQKGIDRQGGLGRSRAYETPTQRKIREALHPNEQVVKEHEKFYPGLAPPHLQPPPKKEKVPVRHAYRAGNFSDIFKQLVVQTVVDLKVQKKESPVWYVEPCGGEGEYHVSRLRKPGEERPPMYWPTAEVLFEALDGQDMTYMPPEVRGWMETVRLLNRRQEGFEVEGPDADADPEADGIQWLPSTAMMALRLLRKQDPVTIFEDNPVGFAALFNFVRNFGESFAPHIELIFADGFKSMRRRYVEKKDKDASKAHGPLSGQRGIVFVDPDYTRGSEAARCKDTIVSLRKHWHAATVMVTYPLGPKYEHKARQFNRRVHEGDPSLDLLMAEVYVDTPGWTEGSEEDQWRGCGVLVSSPPHTCAERIRAALSVVCQELAGLPGASEMRVVVEQL
mmetsp:Transcript_94305/g.299352  ORF Transcript_94305/g.299352 Transcript_94305/m.299352 type:complete len:461 (+) Transcript_94305:2-1384(+)